MSYFVYILSCSDGTYYTGVTNDLERRMSEHKNGYNSDSYTAKRLPVELKYFTPFSDVLQAISFEKKLKKWSSAKRNALINGEWEKLPNLAKKTFG